MRANWTEGAAGWVANEAVYDAVFGPVTRAILDAAAPAPGLRVLDVGCGTGTLLAATDAAGAAAVGVDISATMAEAASRRVPGATVIVEDAQTADLLAAAPGTPFDRVVSRFGVMFFDDPVAAFANLRAACAPGARLVFACWRGEAENPVFTAGTRVLAARLDPPPAPEAPGEPGPMAFAESDRTAAILKAAGWDGIAVDAFDFLLDYGFDGGDGVEQRIAGVLAGRTGRLAQEQLRPALGDDAWESLVDEVRADLDAFVIDGAVRFPGAVWLVSATNPGPA
ncbi:class I SAM-dependent methyltransferase [Glycomyces paridis]|uniref:Class I SAM-dependent methyltransferase n=2 Tax=Glycomyces paridis TaxID=2126555 RepID=A0A4V4HPR8_9ACTN|nr:class I SAM-dependent methyltransferase [Glycomyces paridis]